MPRKKRGPGTGNLRGEGKTGPRKPQKRCPGCAGPRTGHGAGWKKTDPPPCPAVRCGAGIFCGAPENPGPRVPRSEHYPSLPPTPPPQYLDLITPASPRSEAGYEDTITLAPPPGVYTASSKPANAGLPVQVGNKISRVFSARTDNEPQSYKEAMADSTKWQAAIKSELDSHIENGTWEPGELPPGRREISSK